jgi:hypothetical protein
MDERQVNRNPGIVKSEDTITLAFRAKQAKFDVSLYESRVETREFAATHSPNDQNKPAVVVVPSGYGFYFSRAINNGWTDNKDNGSNPPLQGWDFQNDNEYLPNARRAQLVARSDPGFYVAYDLEIDHSRGGTRYYPNRSGTNWNLYWYMNDDLGRYGDNRGTANVDFLIFRI